MPSTRKKETKDGRIYYEITVSRGRGKPRLYSRWYPPDGWSQRAIDRELAKVAAEFERQCKSGEIISRAEQRENELHEQQEAAKVLTLRQYGETVFMPAKQITVSENTRALSQHFLNHWIYPAIGDLKMPDITSANISALLLSIQSQGKSVATAIKCYATLKSLFKMAYMSDTITRNPMDKVERPRPRKDEKQADMDAYTADELRHILECLSHEPLKWQACVRLLIDTGIRRGECCGLQWEHVDFENNTITIADNLCYTPAAGVYLDTPKNGKTRTIDVDPSVIELLRELRAEQAQKAISSFVFTKDGSPEPMHPQSPTKYLARFSRRYNIPDLHPHKLRHSFASVAITSGADIASVSEKLGHSDKSVTLRMYTHADDESIRRASQIFRDAIKKAGQE